LQESGAGIRRQVALRVYGEARRIAAEYQQEPTRPLDQVPTRAEGAPWEVRGEPGVLQSVRLFFRERVTGNIIEKFYNVKTAEGITRQEAIDRAMAAYVGSTSQREQTFEGAFHTGTAFLVQAEAA
jgi:hypothetical protein